MEGSVNELKRLHNSIQEFCDSERTEIILEAESDFDPAPYNQVLSTFRIEINSELNHFRVKEDQLILSGKKRCLTNFAQNIPFDAEPSSSGIPYHVHYDWIGREDLVSEESIPIVIGLEK